MDFDSCNVGVTYKYTVINKSGEHSARVGALVVESLVSIIDDNDIILEPREERVFEKYGTINICDNGGSAMKRKALVVASPVGGGRAAEAADEIIFDAP